MYEDIFMIISMLISDFYNYNTRQASLFRVPLTRTNLIKSTLRYTGLKIWNRFSGNRNHKLSIGSFKINI